MGQEQLLSQVAKLRGHLWANRWRPVPILNWNYKDPLKAGKAPPMAKWQLLCQQDPPHCLTVTPREDALNTGIWCGGLRAVDLDIDDAELVQSAVKLALEILGATIVRSRENSPRCLLVYRAAEGEPPKRSVKGATHSKQNACKIEGPVRASNSWPTAGMPPMSYCSGARVGQKRQRSRTCRQ